MKIKHPRVRDILISLQILDDIGDLNDREREELGTALNLFWEVGYGGEEHTLEWGAGQRASVDASLALSGVARHIAEEYGLDTEGKFKE